MQFLFCSRFFACNSKNQKFQITMDLERVVTLIKQGICIYTFSLIILGTVGNLITITICLRKRLRQINTFKFFAFNAFLDTIGLYGWNVRQFVYYLFYVDLSLQSLVYCDLSSFFQYVSFEASAWFLVILTIFFQGNTQMRI